MPFLKPEINDGLGSPCTRARVQIVAVFTSACLRAEVFTMCVFMCAINVVDASTCLTEAPYLRLCTAFLIFVSFNFPMLLASGLPAGPWPPGFLTEFCAVWSWGPSRGPLGLP